MISVPPDSHSVVECDWNGVGGTVARWRAGLGILLDDGRVDVGVVRW